MARKSRRVRKKGKQVRLSPTQLVQPGAIEVEDAALVATKASPGPQVTDLREEYHYVITDLKRIGAIALAMLALLIVLALLSV